MTEQTSKLASFYVGFNGVFEGGYTLVFPAVEHSVNARRDYKIPGELTAYRNSRTEQ
jgi:hypothetical protein